MYREFLEKAMQMRAESKEDYMHLHKNAEQGLHLPKTISYVKERLISMGYAPYVVGEGVVAEVGGGQRCILLRADMDALPIAEESGLEYSSTSENMHACGHDMHTAMLLCAAKLLKGRERELNAKIKLCFQPGEETLEGAKVMINAGLLVGVDHAAMIHVLAGTEYPTGTVIIPPAGIGASGADFFCVRIKGKGCHGSTPYLGCDPIVAASATITALSSLISREVPTGDGDVLSIGKIEAGKSANAIPESAVFYGTVRSYNDKNRVFIKRRLGELSRGIANAYRCSATVNFLSGAPSFINSEELVAFAKKVFADSEIPAFAVPEGQRGGGSEDFAYVSREVPAVMLCISAGSRAEGYTEPLHSSRVRFNEEAILYGGAAYAAMGFMYADGFGK